MKKWLVALAFALVPAVVPALVAAQNPPADDKADGLVVYGVHAQKKPTDPVPVRFDKIAVKNAKFDPKNLEGGSAEVDIDVTSLKTDSAKRDAHLKSGDYLSADKFGTINVKISNVKKKGDKSYSADASVTVLGKPAKWPVTFEVLETLPDGVRVRGEKTFTRKDVGVGKEDADPTGQELRAVLTATIKPTK